VSEWCRYNFDLLDHERIAGADLTHFPRTLRETMREAMHALYWRAIVTLQRQRSDDGLIGKHALWGPLEARRAIAVELVKVGMLEERGDAYYPRNYLEKNRKGKEIREQQDMETARKAAYRKRLLDKKVTRESRGCPASPSVCVSLSVSDSVSEGEPERESGVVALAPVPRPLGPSVGGMTYPPETIELDDDIRQRCFSGGVRMATKDDVRAMLDYARDRGRTSADWKAALVGWIRKAPQFERKPAFGDNRQVSPNATPGAKATAALIRRRDSTPAEPAPLDLLSRAFGAATGTGGPT
jgi:hypothetical protein